ncbi:MAG TPA: outer membrane beta-barrel protein [Polyangia bacterium]|nr:outer membrane beta-barrel protein [Polyangia bacterium]
MALLSPLAALGQTPPPADAPPAAPPPAAAPPAAPVPAPAPAPAAVAAPAPAPAPAPAAPPAKTWKDLVTFDGLVDAYYLYNLNGVNSLSQPGVRQFDTNSNTFTLNLAKLGIGVSADNVGLRIDMGYGSMGNIINGTTPVLTPPPAGSTMPGSAIVPNAFLIEQAYATVIPVDNFTIDFGKFTTTAGAEVIEANKNWLYSRSFLFFNIPLVHTGLRLGYKINDMVSVQGSVVNGWNGQGFEIDTNKDKTIGLSVSLTLPGGVSVIPTVYFGKEGSSTDTRFLGDLVAAYSAGALGLNLNVDYVNDKAGNIDNFFGVAAMGHYAVADHLSLTVRGEYAQQKFGDTTNKLEEFTLGAGVPMAGRFEFRPEFRMDFTDPAQFVGDSGAKKTQATLTGAFLAWF